MATLKPQFEPPLPTQDELIIAKMSLQIASLRQTLTAITHSADHAQAKQIADLALRASRPKR